MNHILKCDSFPFHAVANGTKAFEFRKNDRNFRTGDTLTLREIDHHGNYTGYAIIVGVGWILYSGYGLPEGYCIMSIFHHGSIPMFNRVFEYSEEAVARVLST